MGLLFAFIQVYIATSIQPVKYNLKGHVDQVNKYCEGARPTKETIGKAHRPMPFPYKTFYVIKGDSFDIIKSEIIETFSTNSKGDFSIHLNQGTYSFLLDEQVVVLDLSDYENDNYNIDTTCIAQWREKPFYTFEITDHDLEPLNFSFVNRCFLKTHIPCITYNGAMKH